MKRDQLIKFMIAQRIKMYESAQAFGFEVKVKELQAVIEMIDGLAKLEEEDDMRETAFHKFMEMLLNSKDNEDTEE
ncbi:hypothetical protein [Veillonella sp. VA142]|uniref:hypothetical protein n=1 Tax=Veillonella sp. VA142 TaxID=741834 RepID=UPI000F8DB0E4|nr:hypothetical protein [Veillonella sp. VA142]